jgi:hypothetical protein
MPYDDPNPVDPMVLNGVAIDTDGDTDSIAVHRDMAACFIEEFFRMGFAPERILKMFQNRGYAGPARAYRLLGESEIRGMIERQVRMRGGRVAGDEQAARRRPDGNITLTILDP